MVRGIDLDVIEGEIFGIGGLAGQGEIGIPNRIMGLYETEGAVTFFGEALELDKLGNALEHGIACVSEDCRGVGLLLEESIEENIAFSAMQVKENFLMKIGPLKLFDQKKAREHAKDMIKLLDIRCTRPKQPVGALSGRNQQKVCHCRSSCGRCLCTEGDEQTGHLGCDSVPHTVYCGTPGGKRTLQQCAAG